MKKILITKKEDLTKYKKDILKLFHTVFEKELDGSLWDWFYIENIFGDPIASLFFDNDELVGHYAVVPYHLNLNGLKVKSALSMTTMVHPNYQGRGFFTNQASIVYRECESQGIDLVYGFPNTNSSPGFEKKLGWSVNKDFYLLRLPFEKLASIETSKANAIGVDSDDRAFLDWRLSKTNVDYRIVDGNIIKEHGNDIDILLYEKKSNELDEAKCFNLLYEDKTGVFEEFRVAPYYFGFRLFNDKFSRFNIDVSLIMSDVF